MRRRCFLQSSLVAALSAAPAVVAAADASSGELYELRIYTLKPAKQPLLDAYLSKAFIPALKRLGIGPVGVFAEKPNEEAMRVFVLIVYPAADKATSLATHLAKDESYAKAAADYLATPASDPVYARIESSLMAPIEGMPRLDKSEASKPRLLNLRIYESHNERAGKKKIEMFNKSELAIFRRVGLKPVFFAETIVGSAMPNLTYMLVLPDNAGLNAAWTRFREDAEWLKLRALPEYADKEIVSHIRNMLLTPMAYSEI